MAFNKKLILQILMDCCIINIAAVTSYFFRFGRELPLEQLQVYFGMAGVVVLTKLIVFYLMGLYKPMWKYAGIDEIMNLFVMVCIANGLIIFGIYIAEYRKVPRSIYLIDTFVDFVYLSVSRFSMQILAWLGLSQGKFQSGKFRRVMIIGAGEAGGRLITEFKGHPEKKILPVCVIDDDPAKKGRNINGVTIVGDTSSISYFADFKKIDQIIIAIPYIKREQLAEILDECRSTGCDLKILPSLNQVRDVKGNVDKILMQKMRDVDIEDLLGREEVSLDNKAVKDYVYGKVVLVSGGGGSIGSELCRQIVVFEPELLVIMDFFEENAYNIQNELKIYRPNQKLSICIANVRERGRMNEVMRKYKPSVIFHAAAHKHVPLMEENPAEAIKNNVMGTWNIVNAALEARAHRFVLISTDKAVNPTNVYGASKRVCETIVQAASRLGKTEFVAVRFGNVLGSSGSVIPLFKRQISAGGPVTVMHPEIIRYFMTIPEAVGLVIQACAMAKGGEIFVLDMGHPVKIDKLARDLIRLSGFEPDVDIKIEYIGLRPGEKLYEELLMEEEGLSETRYEKIYVAKPMDVTMEKVSAEVEFLHNSINGGDEAIVEALKKVVPTYKQLEL